jgi:hypothetical protein
MVQGEMKSGPWLVFNIGCIECGVSSNVVGIYDTQDEAERVRGICEKHLTNTTYWSKS